MSGKGPQKPSQPSPQPARGQQKPASPPPKPSAPQPKGKSYYDDDEE